MYVLLSFYITLESKKSPMLYNIDKYLYEHDYLVTIDTDDNKIKTR